MEISVESALSLWDQAGERPHEVLAEYGLYEYLLNNMCSISIDRELYRGSNRYYNARVGDKIEYKDAKSWTFNLTVAENFVYGTTNLTILVLKTKEVIGIRNDYNSYQEEEIVFAR